MKEICMTVMGTRGDVFPVAALANVLSGTNRVTVITSPDQTPFFERIRLTALAVGEDFSAVAGSGDIARFRRQAAAQFDAHREAYERADVIVGAGLFYAGRTLAEHYGKPYYHLFYTPQVLQSARYAPAGYPRPFAGRLRNRLLWLKSGGESDFLLRRLINGKRKELALPPIGSVYGHFNCGPGTIIAMDACLARVPPRYAAVKQIDFPYYEDRQPLSGALQTFLANGSAPVVIGFGSAEHTAGDIRELLRQTVEAVRGLGCRAVVLSSAGGEACGEGPDMFCCGYAPHAALLPRTRAIVHHGGAGTVYAALKCGIPQVIVPQGMDQFYWADTVESRGWGKSASMAGGPRATPLRDALRAVLNGEGVGDGLTEIAGRLNGERHRKESLQKLRAVMPECFA